MSLLAIGLSHQQVPVDVLERATIPAVDVPKALAEMVAGEHVAEALVLSTCNRVEVYADVSKFHAGLHEITGVLARRAGVDVPDLGEYLYVHYEDAVAGHVFRVAAGLDSMVVGEAQILGQLRAAYAVAIAEQTAGRALHELVQKALSVGKRVHAETGIDRAGASLVGLALQRADSELGGIAGRSAVVVGAGSMGSLAGAMLRRAGVSDLVVANRSRDNAGRLASNLGARVVGLPELGSELAATDLVVTATGSVGAVVTADLVESAVADRPPDRSLVICDLAVPRDVDAAVVGAPGVTYIDIEALRTAAVRSGERDEVRAAEQIVADEVLTYLAAERSLEVAPTVTALRTRAGQVIDAELDRLDAKLPGLDPRTRAELASTVRRTVSTLLHAPTVRVKQLAGSPDGGRYAAALRELFELDPATVDAVRTAATGAAAPPDPRTAGGRAPA